MFDRIDAAVYHPIRNAAYFFRGTKYLKYDVSTDGVQTLAGSKIRRIGVDGWRSLPEQFRSDIDAAFCYSNGYIYFFKGSNYVKYKPGEGVVPTGSGNTIRTIGVTGWTSFPNEFRSGIDAAIYYPDNRHAYFFKDDAYIKYKPGLGVVKYDGSEIRHLGITGWQGSPLRSSRGSTRRSITRATNVCTSSRSASTSAGLLGTGSIPCTQGASDCCTVGTADGRDSPRCSEGRSSAISRQTRRQYGCG